LLQNLGFITKDLVYIFVIWIQCWR